MGGLDHLDGVRGEKGLRGLMTRERELQKGEAWNCNLNNSKDRHTWCIILDTLKKNSGAQN